VVNYAGGLVTIAATDFDQVWKFYAQLLGQEPQPFTANVYAEFNLPGICLGIFRPKAGHPFISGRGALSLCLEVDDLEQAIAHAQAGYYASAATIVTASHGREADVYDPEGNRIILHQGHPRQESKNPGDR
jgi:predicted enzyme related to lactoylglutathione lyase